MIVLNFTKVCFENVYVALASYLSEKWKCKIMNAVQKLLKYKNVPGNVRNTGLFFLNRKNFKNKLREISVVIAKNHEFDIKFF